MICLVSYDGIELPLSECWSAHHALDFERRPSGPLNDALLVVDADVWFSEPALKRLSALTLNARKPVKLFTGTDRKSDLLAIYLPESMADDSSQMLKKSAPGRALELLSQQITAYDSLDSRELDPELPPVRVKNFLDLALLEEKILYQRACATALSGVRIRDPRRISIRGDLRCGIGVEIDLDVIFEGTVVLGDHVKVGAHSILTNATIGAKTRINPFSIIEDAKIGENSFVGPYGRVRPGSQLGDSVQIGNFVEIKNSEIGSGSRINHHAFVGDATLKRDVTLGAGCITCNHNGFGVSRTEIEAGAYVGSGSQLIAPITIGENATVGAGSTITENVPAGKLTLARARQCTIENWSRREPPKK